MFANQTNPFALFCQSLQQSLGRCGPGLRKPEKDAPRDLNDPKCRLINALAEMLPSTLEEVALAADLELPTAQAYLAEMSARSRVMFNPLTKRYSLPRLPGDSGFTA